MRNSILILVLLLFAGCGSAKQAAPGPGVSLLVVGDSLTAGYGLSEPQTQAWPAVLERQWKEEGFLGPGQKVVNAGISGDTSRGGLDRMGDLLREHNPKAVAIALGSNDIRTRVNPLQLHDNLSEMVEQALEQNAQVILIGVNLPGALSLAASGEPNKTIDRVAKKYGLDRADIPLNEISRKNMMLEDQIHPGLEAQGYIAQTLKGPLEEIMSN